MKDLDLKDFVVNYTKNDRDTVPNFLLNIDYNSFDLKSNISPTARIVLLPPMLCWYITERCEVSHNFFTAVELNKTHCLRINDQKLLYFCFLDSWSSTGSAMLLVSVSNTVYLITGNCCFSKKLFTFEKISQFGPVDKLYFDGPLCDTDVERNGIDYIFKEIASIIMRTPDNNKIIIIIDPGLEFIIVEVMKILQPQNNFGQWYVDESTRRIIDRLGYGECSTNFIVSIISARICVHSNLNEIKCNLAVMEGCELIKLKKPRNWKPKMKIYTKGHHTHIFSVVPHFSQKQLDEIVEKVKPKECVQVVTQMIDEYGTKTNSSQIEAIVEKVKPKECVQVVTQMIDEYGTKTNSSMIEAIVEKVKPKECLQVVTQMVDEYGTNTNSSKIEAIVEKVKPKECVQVVTQMIDEYGTKTNLSKIEADKMTKNTAEYQFETINNIAQTNAETTSSKPINPIENGFSSLHKEKNFNVDNQTINTVTEQLNQNSVCPSICEEMTPEVPHIIEQPEPIEVSTHISYKNTTSITLNNEIQLDKYDNFNLQMENDKCKSVENVQFISNQSQNCKTCDTTNNISKIGYKHTFNCEETTFEFCKSSKSSNMFSNVSAKLMSQNEGLKNQMKLKIKHENDNLLPKEIFNNFIQDVVNSITLTNSLNYNYERNINFYSNHFDTHQILQAQSNECEKTQRLSFISRSIENDHNYAHNISQTKFSTIIKKKEIHQVFNINKSSDTTYEHEDTFMSVRYDFINDMCLMETEFDKAPVKKHFISLINALHPAHRAVYLKQIGQENMK